MRSPNAHETVERRQRRCSGFWERKDLSHLDCRHIRVSRTVPHETRIRQVYRRADAVVRALGSAGVGSEPIRGASSALTDFADPGCHAALTNQVRSRSSFDAATWVRYHELEPVPELEAVTQTATPWHQHGKCRTETQPMSAIGRLARALERPR